MERRFPDSLKNDMTGYYLIPKKLRNLTPDATQSLSFAFDADLHCKGDFSVEIERWRLKAGDHAICTKTCKQRPLSEYSYYS
jgi:hypothetical protein